MDLEGPQAAGYPHNRRNRHGEGHGIEQELSEFSGLPLPSIHKEEKNIQISMKLFKKRQNLGNILQFAKRKLHQLSFAATKSRVCSWEAPGIPHDLRRVLH